jgi:PKHD-type hydroxylase
VQRLAGQLGQDDRSVIELTGVYHNLLRRWPTPDAAAANHLQ